MAIKSYSDFIDRSASEKIVLAHVHAVKRLFNFELSEGLYSRVTPHFVVGVRQGSTQTNLISVSSKEAVTDASKFYYEISTSKLYLYSFDQVEDEVIVTYRFFFSSAPINLSWDLQDVSPDVEYQPRINSSPAFKSNMSQGKKSISLMGSGNLVITNTDKALNGIYEGIIWDNKAVKIYSFNRDLNPSEAKLIFRGVITSKSFTSDAITFNVKDSIYALDTKIPLTQYGSLTREADSLFFKRQVYGRVDNLLVQSINQVGDGYPLTGVLTGSYDEDTITGTDTLFMSEVSPNDELIFPNFKVTVEDVLSNTQLRVSKLEGSFRNISVLIKPEIHYRNKNRTFQVASHAIKRYYTTITEIVSRNRIKVASTEGFNSGDIISIEGESKSIRRVSGNTLVLQTNYNLPHSIGAVITKSEINNIRYGNSEIRIEPTNITVTNNPTDGTQITLSSSAEYDSAKERSLNNMFRFYNGRNKIWLGSPTFLDITCTASNKTGDGPIDYSLMGKYFSVMDEEGNEVGFYFKDLLPENQSAVTKPAAIVAIKETDGGKVKSINLESRPYDSDEIASIVANAIASSISAWSYTISGNIVKLESVDTVNISIGDMGTSGFSQNKTATGSSSASEIDLKKFIKVRDFIKSVDQNASDYIEILSVQDKTILLRSPYTGSTKLQNLNYKNVEYIQDDTPVFLDCFGKTKDGTPEGEAITTSPEAVLDVLSQVGLSDRIDTDSFLESIERSPYELSLAIPLNFRATSSPAAKDVINLINQSTLGSLHVTNSLDLGYTILDGNIDPTMRSISDSDIISYTVLNDGFEASSTAISNYRFIDYDPKLKSSNNKQHIYTSNFATNYSEAINTSENSIYFYSGKDAQEITERTQFINELSSSLIKIKGSLSLTKFQIGERVTLDLIGLYDSYGSSNNSLRIGVISSISNNGSIVDIEVLDLGSLFSRTSRICPDDAPNYVDSNSSQRTSNSFITEDNGIIDSFEDTAGTNLIS